MTIASVTTDMNFGPFKIPSNAQNMIMNNYAQRNKLSIEIVIPEPIMSDQLATTIWLNDEFKFKKIILCSIHQLPKKKNHLKFLISQMKNVEFCFAIEGLQGIGEDFIKKISIEAKFFQTRKSIDSNKTNWINLYKNFLKKSNTKKK